MSDNQLTHEVIRDVGYLIRDLNVNETVWFNVKRDDGYYYTARASKRIPCGKSETALAIEKAFNVTRGNPDPRDKQIDTLVNRVKVLEEQLKELKNIAGELTDCLEAKDCKQPDRLMIVKFDNFCKALEVDNG